MIVPTKKQVKITRLWRKAAGAKLPEDCEELDAEIKQLEQKLSDKQRELFQLQRHRYKRKLAPKRSNFNEQFIRPEKIIALNSIEHLERNVELMSMLSGMEVRSYVADDHCVIIYHMQHRADNAVEHGLRINMKTEPNTVSKLSLPLGFNFNAVVEEFDNIMNAECLGSVRKALVAYYDRLEQFQALQNFLSVEGQLFKVMDGTHMEITFKVCSDLNEEQGPYEIVLMLDYGVSDIRPKQYAVKEDRLPEGAAAVLKGQCAVFKSKPLRKAFKECFVKGSGPYKFVCQAPALDALPPPRQRKRPRTERYNPNNDDTFRLEDCSGSSSDEDRQMEHYGRRN